MTDPVTRKPTGSTSDFIGSRWGFRILIPLLYWVCLTILATFTLRIKYAILLILASAALTGLVLFLMRRVIQRWFKRTHLMYGYFCIVFLLLAYVGNSSETRNQSLLADYLRSDTVQDKLGEVQRKAATGDLPYTSYDELVDFTLREFPQAGAYALDMWTGRLLGGTSSYLFFATLLGYIASLTQYKRANKRQLKDTFEATTAAHTVVEASTDVISTVDAIQSDCMPSSTELGESDKLGQHRMPESQGAAPHENPETVEHSSDLTPLSNNSGGSGEFIKCQNCGRDCQISYDFCPDCGFELRSHTCQSCGRTLLVDQIFCPMCGERAVK